MFIEKIQLENFRNYETLLLLPDKGVNVFFGNNGHGKTNILESVFFCAIGRSFRYSRDPDLIRSGNDRFKISLDIGDDITNNIQITYKNVSSSGSGTGEKAVRVNGLYLSRLGQLMGNLLSVIFSPEDLEIVNEGPSVRRKLLDIAISQLIPAHYFDLQQLNKIIAQKNAFLRDFDRTRSGSSSLLDVYNDQLSDTGARISYRRLLFSKELEKYAAEKNDSISSGEPLAFQYSSNFFSIPLSGEITEILSGNTEKSEQIRTEFSELLNSKKEREIERGHSLFGPQNDDLIISLKGMDLRRFGSQGQKRTVVLSIKLAEAELLYRHTGRKPVMLLDDVFSELDEARCSLLLRSAEEFQTMLTSANLSELPSEIRDRAKIFLVNSGHIELI